MRAALAWMLFAACASAPTVAPTATDEPAWRELFDGRSLAGWTSVQFGGEGSVRVQDGQLLLDPGSPLTGVLAEPALPDRYELQVTATRLLGNDFFCAITFPVAGSHLTLVLGGWGGTVCGLSSLDGLDAARNDTRRLRAFRTGVPVLVHVAVTPERVAVDLDGAPFLAADLRGHTASLRAEMDLCKPFALASYNTRAAFRRCAWRPLP